MNLKNLDPNLKTEEATPSTESELQLKPKPKSGSQSGLNPELNPEPNPELNPEPEPGLNPQPKPKPQRALPCTLPAAAAEVIAALAQTVQEAEAGAVGLMTPSNYGQQKFIWQQHALAGDFSAPVFVYDREQIEELQILNLTFLDQCVAYSQFSKEELLQAARPGTDQELLLWLWRLLDKRLRELSRRIFQRADYLAAMPAEPAEPMVSPQALAMCAVELPTDAELARWRLEAERWQSQRSLIGKPQWAGADSLRQVRVEASELVDTFNATFEHLQLRSPSTGRLWSAELSGRVTAVTVEGEQARILVPVAYSTNALHVGRLIAHEIEGHAAARVNTEGLFRFLLRSAYGNSPLLELVSLLAKSPDESLNEAAAKLSEVRLLGVQYTPAPFYALAADWAFRQRCSFATVAKRIYDLRREAGVSLEVAVDAAWRVAYRTFRGGGDTKNTCYKRGYDFLAALAVGNPELAQDMLNYATLSFTELGELRRLYGDLDPVVAMTRQTKQDADVMLAPVSGPLEAEYWLRDQFEQLCELLV